MISRASDERIAGIDCGPIVWVKILSRNENDGIHSSSMTFESSNASGLLHSLAYSFGIQTPSLGSSIVRGGKDEILRNDQP